MGVGISMAAAVNPLWIAGPLCALALAQFFGMLAFMKQPLTGVLMMALVAYDPCTIPLGTQVPAGNCIDEGSGIVGMFLIKKGFDISTVIDQTTLADAITAKDLTPIKDIEAYWPVPTQQTVAGIAGRPDRHGYFQYEMTFKHEGVDANIVFWNTVNNSRDYGIVFITEEYKAFAALDRGLEAIICSITAWPASEQEFGKPRFFSGNVKWKNKDLVYLADLFTPEMMRGVFQS